VSDLTLAARSGLAVAHEGCKRRHRQVEIHAPAIAVAVRLRIDCKAEPSVLGEELVRVSRRRGVDARAEETVPIAEAKLSFRAFLDPPPTLVQEAVVLEAEKDEVSEARLSALCPVQAVVGLEVAPALAAGEAAAAAITGLEQATERRRHRSSATADADRQPRPLDLRHRLRVAAQAARGLGRDDRAVFDIGTACVV
jgi:hypothetical protein